MGENLLLQRSLEKRNAYLDKLKEKLKQKSNFAAMNSFLELEIGKVMANYDKIC
jgi:hypothetical protein